LALEINIHVTDCFVEEDEKSLLPSPETVWGQAGLLKSRHKWTVNTPFVDVWTAHHNVCTQEENCCLYTFESCAVVRKGILQKSAGYRIEFDTKGWTPTPVDRIHMDGAVWE
jgi:hypothetical protein